VPPPLEGGLPLAAQSCARIELGRNRTARSSAI